MTRVLSMVLRGLVVVVLLADQVQGQAAPAAVPAVVPGDSTQAAPARKSAVGAAFLGLVLPGSGHWYAGERGRGALVAAVYFTGYAVVHGGRTDRVGLIVGVVTIGAVGFSIIDGVRAVRRFNRRQAPAAPLAPPP